MHAVEKPVIPLNARTARSKSPRPNRFRALGERVTMRLMRNEFVNALAEL